MVGVAVVADVGIVVSGVLPRNDPDVRISADAAQPGRIKMPVLERDAVAVVERIDLTVVPVAPDSAP